MAVPLFVGAGTGVTITGVSGTVSKTGCTAGNFIILHGVVNGTGQSPTIGTVTNAENLAGTDGVLSLVVGAFDVGSAPQTGVQVVHYGRVLANGTVSVDLTIASNDFVVRLYELSGVSANTTVATVTDNSASGTGVRQSLGNSTTPTASSPAATTNDVDRLALAFVGITGNVATSSMTGETGGYDWVEAVAEYADTPGTIQLQTADMAVAGSINAGSQTVVGTNGWAVDTTALIFGPPPVSTAPSDNPPIGFLGRGAGW